MISCDDPGIGLDADCLISGIQFVVIVLVISECFFPAILSVNWQLFCDPPWPSTNWVRSSWKSLGVTNDCCAWFWCGWV